MDSSTAGVAMMAPKLHVGARPSSVDMWALHCWLVQVGRSSSKLQEEMASWVDWLTNYNPPWAMYWALMAQQLVALDKQPATQPVGIREVWQRLLAKCILAEEGEQGKSACGSTQLCVRMKAGIEGSLGSGCNNRAGSEHSGRGSKGGRSRADFGGCKEPLK